MIIRGDRFQTIKFLHYGLTLLMRLRVEAEEKLQSATAEDAIELRQVLACIDEDVVLLHARLDQMKPLATDSLTLSTDPITMVT